MWRSDQHLEVLYRERHDSEEPDQPFEMDMGPDYVRQEFAGKLEEEIMLAEQKTHGWDHYTSQEMPEPVTSQGTEGNQAAEIQAEFEQGADPCRVHQGRQVDSMSSCEPIRA